MKTKLNAVNVVNKSVCAAVADLQRGLGGPLHGPEGAGGPERAPGW